MKASTYFPNYPYSAEDVKNKLAQLSWLDLRTTHPFDTYHSHNYYEIFVFFKGGGEHTINFKTYPVKDYSIHLLAANHIHCLQRDKSSHGFFIMYRTNFLEKLAFINPEVNYAQFFSGSHIINLSPEDRNYFANLFQEIKENAENSRYMLSLISFFFTKMVVHFSGIHHNGQGEHPGYSELVIECLNLIKTHFKTGITTSFYAEKLCVSTSRLRKAIKQQTGKTLKEFQQERLLSEARNLLYDPSISLNEISEALGFKQPAHFSAWFKRKEGLSPRAYREQ